MNEEASAGGEFIQNTPPSIRKGLADSKGS
jgi:hypothetical protein